ncbi:UNVERIFIED_CONTAM: hypothetical protein Sindi_2343200 [Sesamum indicum]
MRVFKWTPTFTPAQESSVVPIWVSFPELPAHLFHKDALYAVASKEFDIQINGISIVQKIEYEQVPKYCTLCKHVGHQDLEPYSKGNNPKPASRCRNKESKEPTATTNGKGKEKKGKEATNTPAQQALDGKAKKSSKRTERGECSYTQVTNTEPQSFAINGINLHDDNDEILTARNDTIDNMPVVYDRNASSLCNVHELNSNVEELRDDDIVGHYEGVAMEAPVQCVALIPFSPNPFALLIDGNGEQVLKINQPDQQGDDNQKISRNQLQTCTFNQAANENELVSEK